MNVPPTLPSDRQLVEAARSGHDAAWAELMARHEAALRAVLPGRSRSVQRETTRALDRLRSELAPDPGEGVEAVRAFRPRVIAAITAGRYGPDPSVATAEQEMLAHAFGRLPEPWQTVLWHTHVEQLSAAEVSPLVGRSVNEVTELLLTAERGLTDAFLFEYCAQHDLDDESSDVVALLGGYARGALAPRDERRVEEHLGSSSDTNISGIDHPSTVHRSADSRRLLAAASSLATALPPAIAPGVAGLEVDELRRTLGTTTRSFGADTMVATRSDRVRRAVVVGSIAAIGLALVGVGWLVQQGDNGLAESPPAIDPSPGAPSVAADPSDDDPVDSLEAVAPTTDLVLRPTGPENEIDLSVNAGTRASGLVDPRPPITTRVTAPAPIFAGGTGTLDLSFENDTPDDVVANVEMQIPRGVVFDALAEGEAECADPNDDSPFCDIVVGAGSTLDLSVRFTLESAVVGGLVVDGDSVTEPFETEVAAIGDLVHSSVGRGDVVVIGNTAMSCDTEAAAEDGIACDEVHNGTSAIVNRWDVPVGFVDSMPELDLGDGSAAILDLPADASVLSAHLFWGGDVAVGGVSGLKADRDRVTFVTPDGEAATVDADEIVLGEEDGSEYFGRVDVTDLVRASGGGEYLVGDIVSVEAPGAFAAWTLAVVTDDDSLPRRQRIVLDPFEWVAPEAPYRYDADLPVPAVEAASAGFDVVAFEGERGFVPESLTVANTPLGGDNPFDSTIVGERTPSYDNNLGVDIDTYDLIIDTPNGILPIEARSDDDGFRIAVIGLTVDVDT